MAVMGPNGSGKSTLGKIVKGLLSPAEGEVRIGGVPVRKGEVSLDVGYVFSNPENQIVSSVVEEDVAFGLGNMGMEPAVMQDRVSECLRLVGMEGYRTHSPHLLSGGQQQKVVLAGILAMGGKILVLDEPTSMLDFEDREEILDLLQAIHKGGTTVLHITHSFEEALRAQELVFLEDGRISFQGPPEEFISLHPKIEEKVQLPSLYRLVIALRERGLRIPPGVFSYDELREILSQVRP